MNKVLSLLFIAAFFLLGTTQASADEYRFTGANGCLLKKYQNQKWSDAPVQSIGNAPLQITPSKRNPGYSNFTFRGALYISQSNCFTAQEHPKWYVEARGTFAIMGASTASTQTAGTLVETFGSYTPNLGMDFRAGYWINERSNLFFDFGYFSASQTATLKNGATVFSGSTQEKISNLNLGYQMQFSPWGKFIPFADGSIGYSLLSGSATIGTYINNYSSSSVNFDLEVGTLYDLFSRFSLVGIIGYRILSFSTAQVDSTNIPGMGTQIQNTMPYSHIQLSLGARYSF